MKLARDLILFAVRMGDFIRRAILRAALSLRGIITRDINSSARLHAAQGARAEAAKGEFE
jgi:hypothetical protein